MLIDCHVLKERTPICYAYTCQIVANLHSIRPTLRTLKIHIIGIRLFIVVIFFLPDGLKCPTTALCLLSRKMFAFKLHTTLWQCTTNYDIIMIILNIIFYYS